VSQLGELGMMGMFVPAEYGGSGSIVLSYVLALEEICYADAGVGVIMSVQHSLAAWPILAFGTEAQKLKYLPQLARAEKIGCYALTEPGAGSDAGAQKTKATKQADGSWCSTARRCGSPTARRRGSA
jgi:alkylation response protein AidB-like acyl-CoA dehydrogenase